LHWIPAKRNSPGLKTALLALVWIVLLFGPFVLVVHLYKLQRRSPERYASACRVISHVQRFLGGVVVKLSVAYSLLTGTWWMLLIALLALACTQPLEGHRTTQA
jgi:hypothetical protein